MPHLDIPGASLYYETEGSIGDPPVLLIHAGVATLRMWDTLVPSLARDHYVVRYDTRGFGQTHTENVDYSDRGDARDLLDHLGIARPLLIGCSRGGGIAIDLAVDTPDRARGLVTIGSGPSGFPDTELTDVETALFDRMEQLAAARDWHQLARLETEAWTIGPTRTSDDLDPEFVQTAYDANRPNAAHFDEEPIDHPLEPPAYGRVAQLRIPVLATVGELDISACLIEQQYLVETIPRAEGHVFWNAAHLPSLEHPEEFEHVLTDWMRRHSL